MKDLQKIELEYLEKILAIFKQEGICTSDLQNTIDYKYLEYSNYLWNILPKAKENYIISKYCRNTLGRIGMEYL